MLAGYVCFSDFSNLIMYFFASFRKYDDDDDSSDEEAARQMQEVQDKIKKIPDSDSAAVNDSC